MINLSVPTKLSLAEAEAFAQNLNSLINQEKEELSKTLSKEFSEEINQDYLTELQTIILKLITKLKRNDFPKKGICSHFGVGEMVKNDYVGVGIYQDKLLVTIYREQNTFLPNGQPVGYSKEDHLKKQQAVESILESKVIQSWNGLEDQKGVSLVMDCEVPLALKTGINNYHNLKNVFKLSSQEESYFSDFDRWWEL